MSDARIGRGPNPRADLPHPRADPPHWQFSIDCGGTFTDTIARDPAGRLHTDKRLSSDRAPVEAIRAVLETAGAWRPGEPLPEASVRLGTTVATNALLERRGVRTLLLADEGLGDVLEIGTQERPELFELAIRKPTPLHERVIEVGGRRRFDGGTEGSVDETALRAALAAARAEGFASVAVVRIHAYADPADEERLAAIAREAGFAYVVASSEVAREMGLLARGETAAADAYLTPLLRRHVEALEHALPGARLRFMQSSGGLTDGARFRGPNALLSGPAGGVLGAAQVAAAAGFDGAIGFDMGGTSTDVCLVEQGRAERAFESVVAGVRVRAPMLRVHTVAAGGGSLCRFDGIRLCVGPESAGADPGPLCYGKPQARELAITDLNWFLGRLRGDRFPFRLDGARVTAALERVQRELAAAGHERGLEEIAAGFLDVANESMAQAIAQVSVARGVDPRGYGLVGFGGAGGQHVCAVARRLGIRTVLLHPLAGLLSAHGIAAAPVSWDGQRDAGRVVLEGGRAPSAVQDILAALEAEGRAVLASEGAVARDLDVEPWLDLRYRGTETPLAVPAPPGGDPARAFADTHRRRFGYQRPGREIEIVTARVRLSAAGRKPATEASEAAATTASGAGRRGSGRLWLPGKGRVEVPMIDREALAPGETIAGPALVLEATGSVVIDPGFVASVLGDGVLRVEDTLAASADGAPASGEAAGVPADDPVRLEVFGNRFMSIAEQMGAVLRNTSVSTNIKERLDYSCAVFDAAGGLVANAPHIPVHLGAMGATVRAVRAACPDLAPGDAIATNDPACGGSHLPDVTVVSPVFVEGALRFFVASRGHHADLGGVTPGSMPADSTTLDEEGVLIEPFWLVRAGRLDEPVLRALLEGATYPARNPDDNVADLEAMLAANRAGERLLHSLAARSGLEPVLLTMAELQEAAGRKVAREIEKLDDGVYAFEDALDDGSPICVRLEVEGAAMTIDFAGTAAAQAGNLNAPRAVVEAAVIYVLRSLVAEHIPLNGGCLAPVTLRIPPASLLDPPAGAAVVGGNVETSQRIVDVLLGALGLAAASQGTMNNVTFGNARFGYYETIGGGAGATPRAVGASGVHTHMTNTRITDPEVLESRYPVWLARFALRHGSGGRGARSGGDGLVREYVFTEPVEVSLLTERRVLAPYGLAGGGAGARGRNRVLFADGREQVLSSRARVALRGGDHLLIETPGGGAHGPIDPGDGMT